MSSLWSWPSPIRQPRSAPLRLSSSRTTPAADLNGGAGAAAGREPNQDGIRLPASLAHREPRGGTRTREERSPSGKSEVHLT
jgi:hypothetical protein